MSTDRDVRLSERERALAITALRYQKDDILRQARSRPYAGDRNRENRENLRATARELSELAQKLEWPAGEYAVFDANTGDQLSESMPLADARTWKTDAIQSGDTRSLVIRVFR